MRWTKPRALVERRLRLEVTEKLRPGRLGVGAARSRQRGRRDRRAARGACRRAWRSACCTATPIRRMNARWPSAVRAALPDIAISVSQRDPAGDQGISAHQHDGDQRLCAAGGARLHHRAGCAAARAGHRCAAATDAIEWRPGLGRVRRRRAGAHHRKRTGRRRGRRRGAGAAAGRTAASSRSTWAAPPPRPAWSSTARCCAPRRSRSAAASWPARGCWSAPATC